MTGSHGRQTVRKVYEDYLAGKATFDQVREATDRVARERLQHDISDRAVAGESGGPDKS